MNIATLQKKARELEEKGKSVDRALFEFKMLIAKWEIENKKYKTYSSARTLISAVTKKTK